MKLLIDTHVIIALVDQNGYRYGKRIGNALDDHRHEFFAATISLWEIVIKWKTGRLEIQNPPDSIPDALSVLGIPMLPLKARHVLTSFAPEPATRDPFDRLLLSICRAESLNLLTADRALVEHPLAYRG